MENHNTPITPENVLAAVKEMFAESRAEFDRQLKESRENFDREMKKSREDWERRMKNLSEHIGGVANSQGLFAEEYFFNSFEKGQQNFFGEEFDGIWRNVQGRQKGFMDEYDIMMVNGHAVGIVEVKFKPDRDNIQEVIRKAETLRINFPEFKNYKIYLALATMVFNARLEQECINKGIAIVKQVGDTVTVYDEHIKAY